MASIPNGNDILNAALDLHDRGICVLPIRPRDKRPSLSSWKCFQKNRPDRATVRDWFSGPERNLAVICGAVSGNLAIRDFDHPESYGHWAQQYPKLARSLPTVETARGHHVYFRAGERQFQELSPAGSRIIELGDGELRGGGYCLAPPSIHPTGRRYRSLIGLTGNLLKVELKASGLVECWSNSPQSIPSDSNPSDSSGTADTLHVSGDAEEQAICTTLPTGPGQRNRKVFVLARRLKSLRPQTPVKGWLNTVQEWHRRALPVIRTKEFSETWRDFVIAWERIRDLDFGPGLDAVLKSADCIQIPEAAGHHDDPKVLRLIQICAALQATAGDKPFFLSCRKVGTLLGVKKSKANEMLRMLQLEEILVLVRKGDKNTMRANEWRYRG